MILPGYRETKLSDPFEIYLGPIYETGEKPNRRFALLADERHVNRRDVIHGGMMMTYADATLGALAADLSEGRVAVTLNMQSQFLAPAPLGKIVEVKPELTRRTRSMLFIRGDFTVDGEIVMTASSVWKLLGA
ncbi:MAG TPA: PaaI family thioesterase [Rhizomicrobium sp.]|nr:PaaI family thioesterase [Rhizomicrobium sp.]